MRLWTLHPSHLDPQGLVALWREALLAQAVLAGRTKGYTRHPQLERFAAHAEPLKAINAYLAAVLAESRARGYRFDARKVDEAAVTVAPIQATSGQRDHEARHLRAKLEARSPAWLTHWPAEQAPRLHPLFTLVNGPIAAWERP